MSVAGFKSGIKTVEVLREALGIYDYGELYKVIKELENQGKLAPTKNGKDTNGKHPPLACVCLGKSIPVKMSTSRYVWNY